MKHRDIEHIYRKTKKILGQLEYSLSGVSVQVKLLICKTLCRPIMEYPSRFGTRIPAYILACWNTSRMILLNLLKA